MPNILNKMRKRSRRLSPKPTPKSQAQKHKIITEVDDDIISLKSIAQLQQIEKQVGQ